MVESSNIHSLKHNAGWSKFIDNQREDSKEDAEYRNSIAQAIRTSDDPLRLLLDEVRNNGF